MLSVTDPLTGLLNRKGVDEELHMVTSKNLLHGRFLWLTKKRRFAPYSSSASLSNLEIHTVNALSACGGKRCGWY